MQDRKGYIRVPVQQSAKRERIASGRTHHINDPNLLTGTISGSFVTLKPLHVGSGVISPIDQLDPQPTMNEEVELAAAFFREDGWLVIPGSSLKGAVRSLYEMITYSCFPQSDRRSTPVERGMQACTYRADTRVTTPMEFCPACRVFGARGYTGQIFFHPTSVPQDTRSIIEYAPQRWEPRVPNDGSRKLYTHEGTGDAPVEPHEMLPEGVHLPLRADFRNLSEIDLGLLLMVLGQATEVIYPKFGGIKAHGFGTVKIEIDSIEFITSGDYLNFSPTPQTVMDWTSYLNAARASADFNAAGWRSVVNAIGSEP